MSDENERTPEVLGFVEKLKAAGGFMSSDVDIRTANIINDYKYCAEFAKHLECYLKSHPEFNKARLAQKAGISATYITNMLDDSGSKNARTPSLEVRLVRLFHLPRLRGRATQLRRIAP